MTNATITGRYLHIDGRRLKVRSQEMRDILAFVLDNPVASKESLCFAVWGYDPGDNYRKQIGRLRKWLYVQNLPFDIDIQTVRNWVRVVRAK